MTDPLRSIAGAMMAVGLSGAVALAAPQDATAPDPAPATASPVAAPNFGTAAGSVDEKLEASLAELDALRKQMADEMLPLSRKLASLEADLGEVRRRFQDRVRNSTRGASISRTCGTRSRRGEGDDLPLRAPWRVPAELRVSPAHHRAAAVSSCPRGGEARRREHRALGAGDLRGAGAARARKPRAPA